MPPGKTRGLIAAACLIAVVAVTTEVQQLINKRAKWRDRERVSEERLLGVMRALDMPGAQALEVPPKAPPLSAPGHDDRAYTLSRCRGGAVLLIFMRTFDPSVRVGQLSRQFGFAQRHLDNWNRLHSTLAPLGLNVIGVTYEGPDTVLPFVADFMVPFPILHSIPTRYRNFWPVTKITEPSEFLLNKSGRVIFSPDSERAQLSGALNRKLPTTELIRSVGALLGERYLEFGNPLQLLKVARRLFPRTAMVNAVFTHGVCRGLYRVENARGERLGLFRSVDVIPGEGLEAEENAASAVIGFDPDGRLVSVNPTWPRGRKLEEMGAALSIFKGLDSDLALDRLAETTDVPPDTDPMLWEGVLRAVRDSFHEIRELEIASVDK